MQANKCWEACASAEERGDAADDAEGKVVAKAAAADFKQLKVLLRMLEDRIAQAVPNVRLVNTCVPPLLARLH
jgi:hypothetical protein